MASRGVNAPLNAMFKRVPSSDLSSEVVVYSAGKQSAAEVAWILLPVSAFLKLGAVTLFVVNVGMTLTPALAGVVYD